MKVKISIVIPNYNGRKLLERNLPAVLRACHNWSKSGWEILIVDDASTDDSVEFLKKNYPQIRIIQHQKNQRFAAACNTGVKAAKGKIVVLLNSDVVPKADFLKPLVTHFNDSAVFAVGCREQNFKNGRWVYSGRGGMAFRRGFFVHWREKNQSLPNAAWVTAGSAAYSREKWLSLGGMDRLFRPAYEEDRDLCFRAQKAGWKILFEPKSRVNHHHEATNIKVFGKRKINIISFKNQFLFVWKNSSIDQILAHLFWLPYHLFFSNLRSGGALGIGFLWALYQLPELISNRFKIKFKTK